MDHRPGGIGTSRPPDGAAAFAADEVRQERLARALRERVMEPLAVLRMDAAWMRAHLDESQALAGKLDEALGILANAMGATRDVAAGLRPQALDDLGLAAALEGLLDDFGQRRGIACALQLDERLALRDPGAIVVCRIVQDWLEDLPPDATNLHVGLSAGAEDLVLTLRAGKASPPAGETAPRSPCHVPQALRARVQLLGGSLHAQEDASFGTSLVVGVPCPPPAPGPARRR